MTRLPISMLVAGLMFSFPAHAQQPTFYSCEVGGSYKLEGGGLRTTAGSPRRGEPTKGQRFQVNIQSGAMIGDTFSSRYWERTVVMDNGMSPRGSAYKVFYSSGPGDEFINLAYLRVSIDAGPNKTFIFTDADEVFTGLFRYAS